MTVLAALLIALISPVLGAIADAGGRRKPWLLGLHASSSSARHGGACGSWHRSTTICCSR